MYSILFKYGETNVTEAVNVWWPYHVIKVTMTLPSHWNVRSQSKKTWIKQLLGKVNWSVHDTWITKHRGYTKCDATSRLNSRNLADSWSCTFLSFLAVMILVLYAGLQQAKSN